MSESGDFARLVLDTVKAEGKGAFDQWSEQDRALLHKVARAAFNVQVREMAGAKIDAQQRADLEAQVRNVAVAVSIEAANAVLAVIARAFDQGAKMAGSMIQGLLKAVTK